MSGFENLSLSKVNMYFEFKLLKQTDSLLILTHDNILKLCMFCF